jgi:DUF4097 and DUF4098 domain-containing protein YvlB
MKYTPKPIDIVASMVLARKMRLVSDERGDIERCPIIPDVLLRVAVAGLLAATTVVSATDRRSHTIALPPERGLSVEITVGRIRVHGEARADALIEIVRTAPTNDALSRIPVSVEEAPGEVRVIGLQADGETDPAHRTDVTLRVPRTALLKSLKVMEGAITLSSLAGTVTADVRRGPIEAQELEGSVRLETGIGNITATAARLSPSGLLRLRTFNGNIRLALAESPANARVMALALNGTIQSQIPLKMRDTWGPRWGEATLGSGEPVISLDVITGVIEITVR